MITETEPPGPGCHVTACGVRQIFLPQCHWCGKTWKTSACVESTRGGQVNC